MTIWFNSHNIKMASAFKYVLIYLGLDKAEIQLHYCQDISCPKSQDRDWIHTKFSFYNFKFSSSASALRVWTLKHLSQFWQYNKHPKFVDKYKYLCFRLRVEIISVWSSMCWYGYLVLWWAFSTLATLTVALLTL